MKAGRFSLVLIVVCLIAAAAVPPLREMVRAVAASRQPLPTQEQVERAARKHPRDVYIQLALAQDSEARIRSASRLRRIVSLFPKAPAAHLRLTMPLLGSDEAIL